MIPKIFLKKGREASLRRFHPWIFSGAVAKKEGSPTDGAVVDVYTSCGTYIASGHYQEGSITVRILTFEGPGLPNDFWITALRRAYTLRERLSLCYQSNPQTTTYRLVHGEGDHLPGLVLDYYQGVVVVQAHSAGMFLAHEQITEALQSLYGSALLAIYDKSATTAPHKANLPLGDVYLYKSDAFESAQPHHTVLENGLRFLPDWEQGQKTGLFLDQRENRELLGQMANGSRLLNLFCYSGGFSIAALKGGAALVHSVDSSQRAIDLLHKHIVLNGLSGDRHQSYTTDAFDFLKSSPKGAYDLIVLDPPAFAKHTDAKNTALQAYKRLNAVAFDRIAPGGVIFTFSCSQVVSSNDFALTIFSAAAISGRRVKILRRLTQAPDHPVNIYHPEGEYLKGLVLYVE
ncbi:MAG: class I SAM-dependent rRNA methyltransferase [Prevotellaceae bacterium]|jgi:23S rRNA (cytosine1962-C5)-methyltransferase|nr:class I SAM-dependent rRNA methyltransferase [Prevotellaceae bacterium]